MICTAAAAARSRCNFWDVCCSGSYAVLHHLVNQNKYLTTASSSSKYYCLIIIHTCLTAVSGEGLLPSSPTVAKDNGPVGKGWLAMVVLL